jgi:hypothetical protein
MMLWLIWIVLMLLVPILAGVKVWFDTRRNDSASEIADDPPQHAGRAHPFSSAKGP